MLGKQSQTHLLDQALQEILDMLEKARQVYGIAWKAVTEGDSPTKDIARLDQDINAGERLVRRMVIEHLTLNPEQDLPFSLTLVSIVHDVERLGDYAKSIAELTEMSDERLPSHGLGEGCREIQAEIEPLFQLAIDAIRDDDEGKANELMARHREVKRRTDRIVADALAEAQTGRPDLLSVLVSRYLRRLSAHLSNVVSAIVNPFDKIARNE